MISLRLKLHRAWLFGTARRLLLASLREREQPSSDLDSLPYLTPSMDAPPADEAAA